MTCSGPSFIPAPTGNLNLPFNADHPSGDFEDDSFGLRAIGQWRGFGDVMGNYLGMDGFYSVEWSLAYMHVPLNGPFDDNFVINSKMPAGSPAGNPAFFRFNVDSHGPYQGSIANPGVNFDLANAIDNADADTGNAAGELIYPMMDVVGISGNTFYEPLGSVIRLEVAYNLDKPYNMGPNSAGFNGVTEQDMFNIMFGMDWGSVDWTQTYLFTSRPSTINLQVFDEYIPGAGDRTGNDRIVDIAGGFTSDENHMDDHQVMATVQVFTHYWNDNLNPTLFAGTDLTNGGGFLAPSVGYKYGTHWRFKVEGDFFWEEMDGDCAPPGCHLFDALDDKNQLMLEATYQF